MLTLQLKQCQCSLADGRLDEAFDLARQPQVRSHRRGQDLVTRLVAALVTRSRKHLAAGQILQAKADCDKAALLGGNLADIAQLNVAIGHAMQSQEQVNRECGQALMAARHHVDKGQLSVGQKILEAVESPDDRVDGFKLNLAARRAALESCMEKSSAALAAANWEAAVDHLSPLGRVKVQDGKLRELCGKISDHVIDQATAVIEAGRLDTAGALLAALSRLPIQSILAEQHRQTLQQCRAAFDAVENSRPQEAVQILDRLKAMWPAAKWLGQAAEQARQLGEAQASLRSGPLSLIAFGGGHIMENQPARAMPGNLPLPPLAPVQAPAARVPANAFCLHVDGVGSFRVFTGDNITLGPVSSSRLVDLPLMLDAGAPVVNISRQDEDYFLKSSRPVLVNDTPVVSKLLSNGDRIGLGTRCRITFRRPSAASTSALLDLSGTRLADAGIRQVLLMDRELIIGPGSAAHIRADDLAAPVVIQRRGETLICKSASEITVDGNAAGRIAEIQTGANVSAGQLRFVIAREKGA